VPDVAATPEISVVLPVRDQSDHIITVVESYLATLARLELTFELILVENESKDSSLSCCRELERRHSCVSVIHNERRGFGRAVRAGLAASRGRVICYANCAYTTPATLKGAIDVSLSHPGCLIHTVRERRYPLKRKIGSLLFNAECRTLFGFRTRDVNGTPKVFPRALRDRLSLTVDGSLFDLEVLVAAHAAGADILEMPVVFTPRFGGQSATNVRLGFKLYAGAVVMWWKLKWGRRSAAGSRTRIRRGCRFPVTRGERSVRKVENSSG